MARPSVHTSLNTGEPVSPSSVAPPTKRSAAGVATVRTSIPAWVSREMAWHAL